MLTNPESIAVSNNQPVELSEARSRIAHLEAKIEQADYLLSGALGSTADPDGIMQRIEMARETLKEALGNEPDLMRLT